MYKKFLYSIGVLCTLITTTAAIPLSISEFFNEHLLHHEEEKPNVLLAGLVDDVSSISNNVLEFIAEMGCIHSVRTNIVTNTGANAFRTRYGNIIREKYHHSQECAAVDIVQQPYIPVLQRMNRVRRIQELREYQKSLIHEALIGVEDLDSAAVVLVDFDLGKLPSAEIVMQHAKEIEDGTSRVDALCSNGVLGYGEQSTKYYDTFATVLHPDIFVYPIEWREVGKYWPPENENNVVSPDDSVGEGAFTLTSLFHWLQEQGQIDLDPSDDAIMKPVPVRSCFGGLALYRASKYLDQRCTYSHEREAIVNIKYKSRIEKDVCEHILWKNCMSSLDSDFVAAIQPDMVTTYFKEPTAVVTPKVTTARNMEETITTSPTFGNITTAPSFHKITTAPTFGNNTIAPTFNLVVQPSSSPIAPTSQPSSSPTTKPSFMPTTKPSYIPTIQPTSLPSSPPTAKSSALPSHSPSKQPSSSPSTKPTSSPTAQPTAKPSSIPSTQPSPSPSAKPSPSPSTQPSSGPSTQPSAGPSAKPSSTPTTQPSKQPSTQPSVNPSTKPSVNPSTKPSSSPSTKPSSSPSSQPSSNPTKQPTSKPSSEPSTQPSSSPSTQPSSKPSAQPTPRFRGGSNPSSATTSGGNDSAKISFVAIFSTIATLAFLV